MKTDKVEMAKSKVEKARKELEQARKERADVLWQEIQPRVEEWGRVGIPFLTNILEDGDHYNEESIQHLFVGFIETWLENSKGAINSEQSRKGIFRGLSECFDIMLHDNDEEEDDDDE